MAKWKCEICGNEFENFHAQGFDNKIYCPLCYFKKENKELKNQLEETRKCLKDMYHINIENDKELDKLKTQQKEFINYLEDEINKLEEQIKNYDIWHEVGTDINFLILKKQFYLEILQKYKEIIGDINDKK